MNEIIPVNYENETPTVSGRDLHKFLEVDTPYTTWFERMTEYGFTENADFITFLLESTGGRPSTDHTVTIPMAKEIAMLQRNAKGKEARQYFIRIEEAWNTPEMVMSRALKMADSTIKSLQTKINENAHKVEFFDQVTESADAIDIGEAAKVLNMGIGRNKLFAFLRYKGVLMPNNQPYQEFIDREYFRTIEQRYSKPDGSIHINIKTVVYQKGLDYIRRLYLKERGNFELVIAN